MVVGVPIGIKESVIRCMVGVVRDGGAGCLAGFLARIPDKASGRSRRHFIPQTVNRISRACYEHGCAPRSMQEGRPRGAAGL